jgi:hypothetical protein
LDGEHNSKMTGPRTEAALWALEHGCTRRAAAGAAAVNVATFYRWMEADASFRDDVEKAELKAEAAMTVAVASAVPKNWQAAAWWLERRKYSDYARRDQVNVSIDLQAVIRQVAAELGVDESEAVAEAERILSGSR